MVPVRCSLRSNRATYGISIVSDSVRCRTGGALAGMSFERIMLRRMARGLGDHLWQSIWQIRRQRRLWCGNAIYALGLLNGAAQWLLMHGRSDLASATAQAPETIRRQMS